MTRRKTASERIADHLGCDISDVKAGAYQPGHYTVPIYVCYEDYWCYPGKGRKAPAGFDWKPVESSHNDGTVIMWAKGGQA